ncbi:Methyltransferase domain-containing protein [Hymenobacter daecheongensis DSM 21074]|uniref:Methyltransferase domain-containing protein n=1 Tax=Hymenobacter daecheongensis DSM 21074 TaxID=1121955 RepID=A0A1M6KGX6_9BACT|nr:class I SAM-dependent methyltransferase [Hymenobacter daecheongensis]SHJ58132.1 Methyltransferase domain-containing protein [Hymenobacter daecheongensis DSM 21074]
MDPSQLAAATFDRCAPEYQTKYMNVEQYAEGLQRLCSHLPAQARVLELGCGPGNLTQYLLRWQPQYRILGIDVAPKMLALAAANNPGAEFHLLDCRSISQLTSRFDAVVGGFCLPYLSKPEAQQLIADSASLLEPGGMLYLSTMEDDYMKSGMQTSSAGHSLYIHYHQADYLLAALATHGFSLLHCQRQPFPDAENPSATDLILLAQRQ